MGQAIPANAVCPFQEKMLHAFPKDLVIAAGNRRTAPFPAEFMADPDSVLDYSRVESVQVGSGQL